MKTTSVQWIAPLLLVCGALAGIPQAALAGATVTERPVADFVEAQGTFDLGVLFLPPVPNFFSFVDPNSGLNLSIDYAGLANATCNGVAGTTFAGRIKERALPDGRAEVTVELFTMDAMTFVAVGDIVSGPVIFGVRWQDAGGGCVLNGTPVLGSSMLKMTFINTAPGAPLPDLIQLVVAPEPGQELQAFSVHAQATSESAGRLVRAEANQVARLKRGELRFSVENVSVKPLP
jgi:hypothetical protein